MSRALWLSFSNSWPTPRTSSEFSAKNSGGRFLSRFTPCFKFTCRGCFVESRLQFCGCGLGAMQSLFANRSASDGRELPDPRFAAPSDLSLLCIHSVLGRSAGDMQGWALSEEDRLATRKTALARARLALKLAAQLGSVHSRLHDLAFEGALPPVRFWILFSVVSVVCNSFFSY